jgi:hypothetical protein
MPYFSLLYQRPHSELQNLVQQEAHAVIENTASVAKIMISEILVRTE